MGSQGLIIGYHGCDRAVGEKVLSGAEHLRLSENDYDWLGSGIYFWENSATRAMEWAEEVSKNPKLSSAKIRTPFVVGAVIAPGNCLDLLETDAIRIVESSYRRFAETMAALNAPMPKNVRIASDWAIRRLDCAVINALHHFQEEVGEPAFDTVRAAFVEGKSLYPSAGFHANTHVQLCVRHHRQVVGYFRVLKGR